MKNEPVLIVMLGHDKNLLAPRQWLLQTRGYRVLTTLTLADLAALPESRPVRLLLLCHSLSVAERSAAIACAQSRWPGSGHLQLVAEQGRAPDGILGQLLHTMDGPGRLITLVGDIIREQDAQRPPQARAS